MTTARDGYKLIHEMVGDERIVSLIVFKDVIWVATNRRVFQYNEKKQKIIPVYFEVEEEEKNGTHPI